MEEFTDLIIAKIGYWIAKSYSGIRDLATFKLVSKRFRRLLEKQTHLLKNHRAMFVASVRRDYTFILWAEQRGIFEYGEQAAGAIAANDFTRAEQLMQEVPHGDWYPILYMATVTKHVKYAELALNKGARVSKHVITMFSKHNIFKELLERVIAEQTRQRFRYTRNDHIRYKVIELYPHLTRGQLDFVIGQVLEYLPPREERTILPPLAPIIRSVVNNMENHV